MVGWLCFNACAAANASVSVLNSFIVIYSTVATTTATTRTATTMGKSNQRNYNSVKSALIKGNNNNKRDRERERGGNNKRALYNNIKITLCTIKANEQCKGNLKWGSQTQTKRKAFHWVFDLILKLPFASVESFLLRLISFEVGTNWSIQMQLCDRLTF